MVMIVRNSSADDIKGLIRRARVAQLRNVARYFTREQELCDLLVETANALEDLQWRLSMYEKENGDE